MRVAAFALACLAFAGPAAAFTVRALSVDELAARADRIVHARCLGIAPVAAPVGMPVLEITLGVEEALKGAPGERLVIRQLGGRWSGLPPACRPGDEVLLFLHAPSRLGLTSPVGMEQGVLRVVRTPNEPPRLTGDARLVAALSTPAARLAAAPRTGSQAVTAPLDDALAILRAVVGRTR